MAQGHRDPPQSSPVLDEEHISVRPLLDDVFSVQIVLPYGDRSVTIRLHARAALHLAGTLLDTVAPLVYAHLQGKEQ